MSSEKLSPFGPQTSESLDHMRHRDSFSLGGWGGSSKPKLCELTNPKAWACWGEEAGFTFLILGVSLFSPEGGRHLPVVFPGPARGISAC